MSGLTTTQSTIAQDLDAFSEASWFTSTYLVCIFSVFLLKGVVFAVEGAGKGKGNGYEWADKDG
jgi:hypothetical protein